MMQTTAVVVGAGHAGLAMSRRLSERSIDHVVLERGQVANSWRTGRWPSLRLLTPNWQTRLPGHDYAGDDPDGFMPAAGVATTLTGYARLINAPVRTATTVQALRARGPQGFQIQANDDLLCARVVVLATGACSLPAIPGIADAIPPSVTTLTPLAYGDPGQLPDGGVLVVGASATGVQLAGEIHRSGRPVTLAVGEHVRLPRTYRGRDIFWWLEATGLLAERYDQIDDLTRARHLPSPQLTGTPEAVTTDLNSLTALGIRIVGRLGRVVDGVAQFSGGLANTCALADLKMNRFLNRADEWATATGLDDDLPPPHRFALTRVDPRTPMELDLTSGEITTVLWATGFRPDYSWLDIAVRDRTGRIRHDGGVVTGAPGLYVLGLPVLRTRASTYIHGASSDSEALADHLHSFLGSRPLPLVSAIRPARSGLAALFPRAPPGGAAAHRAVHHLGAAARAGPARLAGGDDISGVRAAALGQRAGQHRPQRAVQPVDVLALQVADRHAGRDLGLPQDLVGQQVPDPGDLGLVKQAGLDRDRPLGDQGAELGRSDLGRVRAERVDVGVEQDAAEPALIEQRQAPAVGELEREPVPRSLARLRVPARAVAAFCGPAVRRDDYDAPAHAEVDAEVRTRGARGPVRGSQPRGLAPHGLPAPVRGDQRPSDQRGTQLAGGVRPADERIGVVDGHDAPAQGHVRDQAAGGLDLRQLGHLAVTSAQGGEPVGGPA
jgi:putative flavoprotein involved in K+ transport